MGTGKLLGKPNKLRGMTYDRLASRLEGVQILLQKPGLAPAAMSQSAQGFINYTNKKEK